MKKRIKSVRCRTAAKWFLVLTLSVVICLGLASCGLGDDSITYAIISENNISSDGFYYTLYENNTVSITGREDDGTKSLLIPDVIDRYKVVSVGARAFYQNGTLIRVVLGDGIKKIEDGAFAQCSSLTSVTLGKNTANIGKNAFSECGTLSEVRGGGSVTDIADRAFYQCYSLSYITFGEGLRTIGVEAFSNCTSLSDVILPSKIESLGSSVFSYCDNLAYVSLGGLTEIPSQAFEKCAALPEIVIGDTVVSIGDRAFRGCENLSDVKLGKKLRSIGASAFIETPWISSITDEFLIVGDGILLKYTGSSPEVTIPKGVKVIADAFSTSQTLMSVTIGNDVEIISDYAFSGCQRLSKVVIESGVKEIRASAFTGCRELIALTLPKTVTYIGVSAFGNCTKLSTVRYTGSNSAWSKITIEKGNSALEKASVTFG
ncbi:MAG: leucine-rich repeat protein [Clostridia bacterium]|nr:leucine-rich repeat protein [Clostridia bacterium]